MSDRIRIRGGAFAGHTATVVSQGAGTLDVEVVVAVERHHVEFPADVVPRLRREIVDAFERWRDDEYLTYFTDSLDWDGYTAHVAAVDARAEARQTAVLDQFDRETAAWSADQVAHAQRNPDAALEPYLPAPVFSEGHGDGGEEPESWLFDAVFAITPSAERDHARRRRRAAGDAALERDYAAWRAAHPAPTAQARAAAVERVARRRPAVEERVARDWGFTLPDSIFRFEMLRELAGEELHHTMGMSPMGILDLFDDPARQPRDGLDVRLHGRYYRDPPEFLTYLHGGTDGLHWGLWFDDGRTCTGVAHYYSNDGVDLRYPVETPIEAVRDALESHWRSIRDEAIGFADPSEAYDAEYVESMFALRAMRELVMTFETADRPETGHDYTYSPPRFPPDRAFTQDGAGALIVEIDGRHDCYDPTADTWHQLWHDPEAVRRYAEEARRRCAEGDSSAALILGRDLAWASGGDPERERIAHEMLVLAYRALGRDTLAQIADLHYRHRDLPQVAVLEP